MAQRCGCLLRLPVLVQSFMLITALSVFIAVVSWSMRIGDELDIPTFASSSLSLTNSTAAWNQEEFHQKWDVQRIGGQLKLQKICDATYWNTWRDAIRFLKYDGNTFVLSDSESLMRIRDSTEQIWPYFAWFHRNDLVRRVIRGVILKQSAYLIEDVDGSSYRGSAYCYQSGTKSLRKFVHDHVRSTGFALDSGAFYIKLLNEYHDQMIVMNTVNDSNQNKNADMILDHHLVKQSVIRLIDKWKNEQHHQDEEDQINEQKTPSTATSTGMIWSQRRPSDEECKFHWNIPSNFMVHHALDFVRDFAIYWKNETMRSLCDELQQSIWNGIHRFGVIQKEGFGDIYVYETSGDGNDYDDTDDVHIPSLISIPLITNKYDEAIYENTRKWILTESESKDLESPLGLINQALTAKGDEEKHDLMKMVIDKMGTDDLLPDTDKGNWWMNSYFAVFANCAEQFIVGDIDEIIAKVERKNIGLVESNNAGILGNGNDRKYSQKDPKTLDFVFQCPNNPVDKYMKIY